MKYLFKKYELEICSAYSLFEGNRRDKVSFRNGNVTPNHFSCTVILVWPSHIDIQYNQGETRYINPQHLKFNF